MRRDPKAYVIERGNRWVGWSNTKAAAIRNAKLVPPVAGHPVTVRDNRTGVVIWTAPEVMIAHSISGLLYNELRHGTELGDRWGYGANPDVDLEVEAMVKDATGVKVGFGHRYTLTGSPAAWLAIRDYAADRAGMEQNLAGDFDASMGKRLQEQADRIATAIAIDRISEVQA